MIPVPAGTSGLFSVAGMATVNFSADSSGPAQMATAFGDTQICFVEPAPGQPNVPRLDLESLVSPNLFCPAGNEVLMEYRATNNDPVEMATLTVTGTSTQRARMPMAVDGDPNRLMSISSPFEGDDFPIDFAENVPCGSLLTLSSDPSSYTQEPITKNITLAPGESKIIGVLTRSYPGCADGSCSEYLLSLDGFFSDGSRAFACVGLALTVSSSCPEDLADGGDGIVDFDDLFFAIPKWTDCHNHSDLNVNGFVGVLDFITIINAFGLCP